ncbi:MAG TPA: hypothetical protein VGD19_01245 [Allosphingosinicella sp.]|jgi:hypothetical protein
MEIARKAGDGGQEFGPTENELTTQLRLVGKPYALYKSLNLLGYFDSPGEAFAAGISQFPDGAFSIQEVGRGNLGQDPLQACN